MRITEWSRNPDLQFHTQQLPTESHADARDERSVAKDSGEEIAAFNSVTCEKSVAYRNDSSALVVHAVVANPINNQTSTFIHNGNLASSLIEKKSIYLIDVIALWETSEQPVSLGKKETIGLKVKGTQRLLWSFEIDRFHFIGFSENGLE